jgi:hypothetical protein
MSGFNEDNMTLSCAFCHAPLEYTFVDLGKTPLANRYLTKEMLLQPEPSYPLHARVCEKCLLVQVEPAVSAEDLFGDYAYFSSFSSSWLEHARRYSLEAIQRFKLGKASRVIEIASNDGYLLKNFVAAGIPCLGIEPARNIAEVANKAGVPTEAVFFGRETAKRLLTGGAADLMAANNVMAHVPDINDFVGGFSILLAKEGVLSVEAPHILKLIEQTQFDTIYHEHYSYFSFCTLEKIFAAHDLRVFDVAELPTHGGSLRVWVCRTEATHGVTPAVEKLRQKEAAAGLHNLAGYKGFDAKVKEVCRAFTAFLNLQKKLGKQVAGYGAAAKGNTLLNVCGIDTTQIRYVCDLSPAKQGHYLPGSHIPVFAPDKIRETKPDFLVILPWNIAPEIMKQMKDLTSWGGQFVTAIPDLQTKVAA